MSRRDCINSLRNLSPAILPSLLLCDFGNLEREIERLDAAGVAALHLDCMDGVFVPNFSYGMTIVEAIKRLTDMTLDVHLMIVNPENYVKQFYDAGADVITFHVEATKNASAVIDQIHDLGAAAGIAMNPGTPVSEIADLLPAADMVLAMSVEAGFGGQKFNESVLEKFKQIRELPGGDDILLEIDGGINKSTVGKATQAGAQLLVAGSAVFRQEDYSKAIEDLMAEAECLQ